MRSTTRIYTWATVIFDIRKWSPQCLQFVKRYNVCRRYKPIFEHKDISVLFSTVNRELQNINEWFISNKLSLNVKKTKFSIFHKASRRDDLPLLLPKLFINNQVIKRQSSIKFLGILLDENLSWKEHLKLTENKVANNIGLTYKAKPYLNKDSLLVLYFFYIHSYINYANLVWRSTNRTYLRKINSQQKQF